MQTWHFNKTPNTFMKHNTSCQVCAEANDLVPLFPLESSLFRLSRLSSILNSRFRWLSSYINTSGFEVVTKSTFCVFSMDREEVYKKFPRERRLYPVILTGQASSINYFFLYVIWFRFFKNQEWLVFYLFIFNLFYFRERLEKATCVSSKTPPPAFFDSIADTASKLLTL